MKYNLPRPYLSYSQFDLWTKNKEGYRRRYYYNEEGFMTPEIVFGKKIAKHMEDGGHIEGLVPADNVEYRIEIEIDKGLKLLGYLDRFDSKLNKVIEIKTGHKNKEGKEPWDTLKVRRHKQLTFYTLLVKAKHKEVCPNVVLQWFETRFKAQEFSFDGHTLTTQSRELELTGYQKKFRRRIYNWERDRLQLEIIRAAEEITKDYTEWQKENQK